VGARVAASYVDPVRLPGLTADGHALLRRMLEHPRAPRYRNRSGHKLSPAEQAQAAEFERCILERRPTNSPPWLDDFVAYACRQVPAFKPLAGQPFTELPTWTRADLARDVERFVPDEVNVERLILFATSGTTGHPLTVPSHPLVAARYQAFYFAALREIGVSPSFGPGHVGIVLAGYQQRCFTYVSVNPTRGESGLAKINLHPGDWNSPDDRAPYLDSLRPDVISGDPISLAELACLDLQHRPQALISTSMAMLPAQRAFLEQRFSCPLLDIYSMNEAGPIAVLDPRRGGHRLLQPDLYVEILDDAGRPVPPGQAGEITVTGGFNFCLPLLRYRTGDHAALVKSEDGWPVLVGLQGRPPVRFRTADGRWLNNLEITHAFKHCALAQYAVHQDTHGRIVLRVYGPVLGIAGARAALRNLFGDGQDIRVEHHPLPTAKVVQYTSALAADAPT
jgi:phenylacetate-CoA ligase